MEKKHFISRSGFEAIFKDCMSCNKTYFADGSSQKSTPIMAIRDFETCDPNSPEDKEFSVRDLEKAWEYFKSLNKCRVMNNNGSIYIDAFE